MTARTARRPSSPPAAAPPVRRVRVVVLNWNGGAGVLDAVASVLDAGWSGGDLEVVVVDNASTDGSPEALVERFGDRVRLVRNDRNTGFGANNLALRHLHGVDAVALVNPDATVEPGWLEPLVAALDADAGLGAACPLIVFGPKFVPVSIGSATFRPGGGDDRDLGVRLCGVRAVGRAPAEGVRDDTGAAPDGLPVAPVAPGTMTGGADASGEDRRGEVPVERGSGAPARGASSGGGVDADGGATPDPLGGVLPVEGVYDLEHGREGPYRWLSGEAELLVPLPGAARDAGPGAAGGVRRVELLLAAEAPTTAVVVVEDRPHEVEVGPEPRWIAVDVAGEGVDVVQNAGSLVYVDGAGADREFGREVTLAVHVPADVFAWCGGAVLLRRAYLEDVGLFHEPFFLYYEDTDLSWRGQARGWRYRFVPGTVVRHAHAGSSGTSSPRFAHFNERNRLLFLFRNAPPALVRREVVGHLRETLDMAWRDTLGPLRRRSRPRPVVAARRARAFAAFVALVPRELGERRRLRRAQQVPDATLLARLTPR